MSLTREELTRYEQHYLAKATERFRYPPMANGQRPMADR